MGFDIIIGDDNILGGVKGRDKDGNRYVLIFVEFSLVSYYYYKIVV